jgi:hypothetical protein
MNHGDPPPVRKSSGGHPAVELVDAAVQPTLIDRGLPRNA